MECWRHKTFPFRRSYPDLLILFAYCHIALWTMWIFLVIILLTYLGGTKHLVVVVVVIDDDDDDDDDDDIV